MVRNHSRQKHGGDIYSLAARLHCAPSKILDFSASINPLGISPRAARVTRDAVDDLNHYPDPQARWLVQLLAAHYNLTNEMIVVGNGSIELIYLVPRVLRPKRALIISPTFSDYERAVLYSGGSVQHLVLKSNNDFEIDPGSICALFSKGIDLLFLCNPNNPTGRLIPREKVVWLVEKAAQFNIGVVLDEAFIDFQEAHSLLNHGRLLERGSSFNLIVLRSFTKFYALAGLRVGYLVTNRRLAQEIKLAQEPWTVNSLAQKAAGESLLDEVYIKDSLNFMEEERRRFASDLAKIPNVKIYPSDANFFLLRLDIGVPRIEQLLRLLEGEGILVRNCASFRGLQTRYLRIAIKKQSDNQRLCGILKQFLASVPLKGSVTAGPEEKGKSQWKER